MQIRDWSYVNTAAGVTVAVTDTGAGVTVVVSSWSVVAEV